MGDHGASAEFGKDLGLMHEAVVTGRKVGAGSEFWAILAHDLERFRLLVASLYSFKVWACYHWPFDFGEWLTKQELQIGKPVIFHHTNSTFKVVESLLKRESGRDDQEVTLSLMNFDDIVRPHRGKRGSLTTIELKIKNSLQKLGYRPALLHEVLSLWEKHSQDLPVIDDEDIAIIGAMESEDSSFPILPLLNAGDSERRNNLFLYQDPGFNCWPTTGWVAAVKL